MEDLIVVIIISLTLLILAFMASMIDLDFDFTGEGKFPKVKLTFKKDPSLFSFLRKSRIKRKAVQAEKKCEEEAEEDYVEKNLFGNVKVKYGERAETIATRSTVIEAVRNDVDKYFLYNSDSDTKVKIEVDGYTDTDFKCFRDFETWKSTCNFGGFVSTNRIAIPIRLMQKGEEKNVKLTFKLKGHFEEFVSSSNITPHEFYFIMHNETKGAVFTFEIPNGIEGQICELCFVIQKGKDDIFEKKVKDIERGQFAFGKFGSGWIRKDTKNTIVQWNIPMLLPRGHVCKLLWSTRRN